MCTIEVLLSLHCYPAILVDELIPCLLVSLQVQNYKFMEIEKYKSYLF